MGRWSIRVSMLPDESLSSWLTRAALNQGCDPLSLTGSLWPKWRIWTLDIDRGLPREHLYTLSRACGISLHTFESAALRNPAELIAGHPLSEEMLWPWIVSLGKRNRKQTLGQPFCPHCLSTHKQPYYRRSWRFAWESVCLQHGNILLQRCPICDAAVQPHRLLASDIHVAICAICKADLRNAPREPASRQAMDVSIRANQALHQKSSEFLGDAAETTEWFACIRYLLRWLRLCIHPKGSSLVSFFQSLDIGVDLTKLPISGLPFEALEVSQRHTLLTYVGRLIAISKENLIETFRQTGVTASVLTEPNNHTPTLIRSMLSALPEHRRSSRISKRVFPKKPKTERSAKSAWERLQRKLRVKL